MGGVSGAARAAVAVVAWLCALGVLALVLVAALVDLGTAERLASVAGAATGLVGLVLAVNDLRSSDTEPPPDDALIAQEVAAYAEQVLQSHGPLGLKAPDPSQNGEHSEVELLAVFVPPRLRADPPPVELPRELRKRLESRSGMLPPGEFPPGLDEESLEQVRRAYRERRPVESLEVLTDPQQSRVVLLGDPGAGKSTLARYLALALTSEAVPEPLAGLAGRVPVIVELRRYADERRRDRSFEDYLDELSTLERMSVPRGVQDVLLREGRAIVVFDGLDELFDPRVRAETERRIAAFAGRYPDVRIVVTSRVIGYRRPVLDKAGFRHYMIQDLTMSQIEEFAERWYTVVCPGEPELAARLHLLLERAVADAHPGPRWLATQLLARYWPEREDVRLLTLDRMTADPSSTNRRNALNWAAWLGEAAPDTQETVRSVALADASPRVRITALRVLAFGWPRSPATTGFLRERAERDEDERARAVASWALTTADAYAALPDHAS